MLHVQEPQVLSHRFQSLRDTQFPIVTAQCPDGTQITFCSCPKLKLPPNTCINATVRSGVTCPSQSCNPDQVLTTVQPAAPQFGTCCPEKQCVDKKRVRSIAKTNAECWPTDVTRNELIFYPMNIQCTGGALINTCNCFNSSLLPPGSCTDPVGLSAIGCGMWSCPAGEELTVVRPAAPELGRCCPERQCVKQPNYEVAKSAEDCWAPSSSSYRLTIMCASGAVMTDCACTNQKNKGYLLPPGTCSNATSLAAVGCGTIGCPEGFESGVTGPAAPARGACCPQIGCVKKPTISAANSDQLGAMDESTASQPTPAWAVALLVLGSIMLLALVVVNAVLYFGKK